MPSVTVRAPAKVNVRLAVGPLRPDGYHDLVNVFLAVALQDRVTATPAGALRVTCAGPGAGQVPLDAGNLAARAAAALAARLGRAPDVHLHIDKDIPVAGGMAGGSADAAAALLACDALWGAGTPRETLHELAAGLGSDVPFALAGGAALGRGRGELLTPLPVEGTFHWVFALAEGGLSTPAVYRECDRLRAEDPAGADVPPPQGDPALEAALAAGDPHALAARLVNDLQPAALSLRPALADTLRAGADAGALAGLVSGSGPTCAFLAADADGAAALAKSLNDSGTCRQARATTAPAPGATTIDFHA
ncbi:4-(cytidine 5'-diphospho)-2-C-methyl-D-erythritol kinase [Streptomyces sp. DSM 44917]|uniref:4-diphosphocytidyl-2-C-methyl-D-erythritol kinase n=1 Tax=Streptomyces boetiae TaxID=3075541 RepID=A0ABU2LC61_9ACTN|nr:4-(cytidine 5'-diphospho)-2-C-methyl-D-erythritol kinase [Streptomyces sp. DSM 44917]MDT0309102.1 4-(cytidine 5'-diphospho)-2-C-methyl-D-erythritol kinase [Streptomyces sp. DSM 44917]